MYSNCSHCNCNNDVVSSQRATACKVWKGFFVISDAKFLQIYRVITNC